MRDGRSRASMALVNVVDSMLKAEYKDHNYQRMREAVQYNLDNVTIADTRWRLALAPCVVFLAHSMPGTGSSPDRLNRHTAVYEAGTEHYTDERGLIAAMLMTSVMRGLQDRHDAEDFSRG